MPHRLVAGRLLRHLARRTARLPRRAAQSGHPATSDLAKYLGAQPVYFSEEQIDFRSEYLHELAQIDTPNITRPERYFLLAATGDTVIDYRAMTRKYEGARQHVIAGSDHELSDFASYIDEVLQFCDGPVGGS